MGMKTLFVDFDGTICHDRFWRSLNSAENSQIQDFLFSGNNSIVVDWMRGAYTSEQINELVAKETGLDYEYLWTTFVHDCKTMIVQPEILNQINEVRNKFHVVLITGNMDCFSRFTVPALQLDQYFDVIVNSFNESQLKTDDNGSSFIKYVKGSIQDAILIEDSEKSCELFKGLGGNAYKVINREDTLKHLQNLI
jgi:phosphoglycolate phosphatase-like HAD superfamily hydrolase